MEITPDQNAVVNSPLCVNYYFVVYRGTKLLFSGFHCGQVTSRNAVMEYYDTEEEGLSRISALGLEIQQ